MLAPMLGLDISEAHVPGWITAERAKDRVWEFCMGRSNRACTRPSKSFESSCVFTLVNRHSKKARRAIQNGFSNPA